MRPTNGSATPSSAATAARSSSGRSPSYLSSTCTLMIVRALPKPPPTTAEASTLSGCSLETRTARRPIDTAEAWQRPLLDVHHARSLLSVV